MAFWEISLLALLCASNYVSCMVKWEISNISPPHCLTHWLSKPWHFGKFHHWPCCVHQIMSHVWSNGKFPIFPPPLFGTLAVKAMAFWEISLSSHQNLPFLKHVKIKLNILIPPSYGLHFGNYIMGIIIMQNAM